MPFGTVLGMAERRRYLSRLSQDYVNQQHQTQQLQQLQQRYEAIESCGRYLYILLFGAMLIWILLILFIPSSPGYVFGDGKSKKESEDMDSDHLEAFAVSGGNFRDAQDIIDCISSRDGWVADSSSLHSDGCVRFSSLVAKLAEMALAVDATVQSQARQVNDGKGVLENLLSELQAAVLVSESLYFSGPAGPALSCNFQLVVTHASLGVGINTTNDMHENSKKHGRSLADLSQQYDETLRYIPSVDFASVSRSAYLDTCSLKSKSAMRPYGIFRMSAAAKNFEAYTHRSEGGRHRAPRDIPAGIVDFISPSELWLRAQRASREAKSVKFRAESMPRTVREADRANRQAGVAFPDQAASTTPAGAGRAMAGTAEIGCAPLVTSSCCDPERAAATMSSEARRSI